jgi:membrane associated rhomboid family serine protease
MPVPAPAAPLPSVPLAVVQSGLGRWIGARIPWFTLTLSAMLVVRFLDELRTATDYVAAYSPGHYSLLAMGASDRALVFGQGEWWRLFTATVLHGSPAHLIGNVVTFLTVGFLLEPMIGIGWFAAIYFTGGLAGALFSTLLNPADVLSVGASGAIMAMLAALFTLSFHAGAGRPALMRRVAGGSLFPALIPTIASDGSVVDIQAHFGGCLTGMLLAFVMLIAWNDEEESPPARQFAAIAAGLWLALTASAFAVATTGYAAYARPGLDVIPPDKLPKNLEAMKADSLTLVEKYPKDPRAHFYRGLYLLEQRDATDAEPYFRHVAQIGPGSPLIGKPMLDWNRALLALSVRVQNRATESHTIVAPLCARRDALDLRTRQTLEITRLCK